jgi:hypothetical protein
VANRLAGRGASGQIYRFWASPAAPGDRPHLGSWLECMIVSVKVAVNVNRHGVPGSSCPSQKPAAAPVPASPSRRA